KYDNVVILRTLSKLGLAGLRLGYLLGSADWLREFDKVRMPYNINSFSQAGAEFALQHYDVFELQVQTLCAERQRLITALRQRDALEVYPSDTNFIMFRVPSDRSGSVHGGLVDRGILIKKLRGPRLDGCFRVTVGAPEQNDMFLASLGTVLER
ncbi:MAG: aminotransferase class I/II-fold pyridoxal phosphate-dependent enzyme, partial [Gammaproteobacteria bacterium]|nr:aminotransferase class I/II-fold pyridoxal phosphate-dependent enzyme [Gammaproteobacteria bacterium]